MSLQQIRAYNSSAVSGGEMKGGKIPSWDSHMLQEKGPKARALMLNPYYNWRMYIRESVNDTAFCL